MASKLNIKKITNFLNEEHKEYSRYTIEERALPSLCDGFKPGARKIMHAAFTGSLKDGKTHKLISLTGETNESFPIRPWRYVLEFNNSDISKIVYILMI